MCMTNKKGDFPAYGIGVDTILGHILRAVLTYSNKNQKKTNQTVQ